MHFKKKNKRPFHIQHTGWIVLGINKLSKTRAYVKKYYMYCCWKAEEHLFAYWLHLKFLSFNLCKLIVSSNFVCGEKSSFLQLTGSCTDKQ